MVFSFNLIKKVYILKKYNNKKITLFFLEMWKLLQAILKYLEY